MPQGDKSKYTDKQKREARHIEEGYESRGVSKDEAERRAWATVNATHHGGEKPGGVATGSRRTTRPSERAAGRCPSRNGARPRRRAGRRDGSTRGERSPGGGWR